MFLAKNKAPPTSPSAPSLHKATLIITSKLVSSFHEIEFLRYLGGIKNIHTRTHTNTQGVLIILHKHSFFCRFPVILLTPATVRIATDLEYTQVVAQLPTCTVVVEILVVQIGVSVLDQIAAQQLFRIVDPDESGLKLIQAWYWKPDLIGFSL